LRWLAGVGKRGVRNVKECVVSNIPPRSEVKRDRKKGVGGGKNGCWGGGQEKVRKRGETACGVKHESRKALETRKWANKEFFHHF